MTPAEIEIKLSMIEALSADEVRGWWSCLHGPDRIRDPFDGEMRALMQRARELGVTL